ncbi:integrase, catalytic region, zinc finger, CCHC-type containing protein [Tanacetum coccineum]
MDYFYNNCHKYGLDPSFEEDDVATEDGGIANEMRRADVDLEALCIDNNRAKLGDVSNVRILQKSQENGQNRTNTDTGKEREYKSRENAIKEIDELIAYVSEKTYAYGAIRAKNQNLLFTISELKTRLANVEKGKSVNTKFDKTNGSQPLLCVTPLNKHVIQKKIDVQKSEENHVVSKPVTLQTSPAKQRGVNSNKNVIAPGMYKVVTTHESQINEAKHDLSSTGMNAASSVRRPMNRDSHVKNSVLANSKKPAKKVAVYVVHIILWIVDSGCSKHMTGLGHNLFSVGQFCDGDLEVAFCSKTCYVRNLEGDDLLAGGRESNLYTISIFDMAASSPVCPMSKATSTKSWLWHRRLSHLNFGIINDLTKLDLVDGLPKFKYRKVHLCSAYEREKSKKASHPLKLVPSDHSKLELLHMDLCRPMRVASINEKKVFSCRSWMLFSYLWFNFSLEDVTQSDYKEIYCSKLN